MLKYKRNEVRPLPFVPVDATFMLGSKYAKEEQNVLFLFEKDKWVCKNKSLDAFNHYYEKENHELHLYECLTHVFGDTIGEKGDNLYFFIDELKSNELVGTYNKPVVKGFKEVNGVKVGIIKCGERFSSRLYQLPQLLKWMGDRKQYSVYQFEDEMRVEFERNCVHLFGWIDEIRAYGDPKTQNDFRNYVIKRFNEIAEIKFVIKGE